MFASRRPWKRGKNIYKRSREIQWSAKGDGRARKRTARGGGKSQVPQKRPMNMEKKREKPRPWRGKGGENGLGEGDKKSSLKLDSYERKKVHRSAKKRGDRRGSIRPPLKKKIGPSAT